MYDGLLRRTLPKLSTWNTIDPSLISRRLPLSGGERGGWTSGERWTRVEF